MGAEFSGQSPTSRRALLTALAAGSTSLSGCKDLPHIGDQSVVLPPFTGAWVDVQKDTRVAVKLHFAGDIQAKIDEVPVSREQLLGKADRDGLDVTLSSVDIPWSPSHPNKNIVTGTLSGYVVTESWPGATWYKTGSFEFLGTDSVGEVSVTFENPSVRVRFPSGYQYTLPQIHTDVSRQSTILVERPSGGLFEYDGMNETRSVPRINHYDFQDAVWMRASAEYRAELFARTYNLFNVDWYVDKGYEDIRDGVGEISSMLGQEAVESVVTSPLPESVTVSLDMNSIHESITTHFSSFLGALESLERGLEAATQPWLHVLTSGTSEKPGWGRIGRLASQEWQFHNPLWVTAHDTERFKYHLEQYNKTLKQQEDDAQKLLQYDTFSAANPSQKHWSDLYNLAKTILTETRRMVQEERQSLDDLIDKF